MLVGYSGGGDSTCLLHLLHRLGVDVVAAHLHHGQRPEADRELGLCQAFADELGVPFVSGRADVPRMAQDLGVGLEEAGRNARYSFFGQAAYRLDCDRIATAHTRTDHVETVLLNLARGAGLHGLAGIPAQRDDVVRPLLPFSREETRAYCAEHGLWTHDDPANEDVRLSRVRVRRRILPELEAINPSVAEAIARLAEVADEEDRFLNGMAAAALERSERPLNGPLKFLTEDVEASFDRSQLTHLPTVLLKRALRLATQALGGSLDSRQTLAAAGGVASEPKGSVTAEGGEVAIEWTPEAVTVRTLRPAVPFRYGLTVPGETISDEFGWQFTAYETPGGETPDSGEGLEVRLDPRRITGQLYFRTAKPGDSMQPVGRNGRRKLTDLLSEAHLTAAAKSRLPVVCDMTGPIWAPGIAVEERVSGNDTSQTVLILRFERVRS